MRHFFGAMTLLAILTTGTGQVGHGRSGMTGHQRTRREVCPLNSDPLYDRQKILKRLAKILNQSVPEYRKYFPKFYVEMERAGGFFIYDLTDPLNRQLSLEDCIEFKDSHVYHFAPFDSAFSFSHILILDDGNLKVFKSINCKNSGDSLEDVVKYLNMSLMNDLNKSDIINRVRNYREYGSYIKFDNFSELQCQEVKSGGNPT